MGLTFNAQGADKLIHQIDLKVRHLHALCMIPLVAALYPIESATRTQI
jgi:hypothetical protein